MKKGIKTFLFVLIFAFINLLVFLAVFILMYFVYGRLIAPSINSRDLSTIITFVLFLLSVLASYGVYQLLARFVAKNEKLAALMTPLFARTKSPASDNKENDPSKYKDL